ncbi:MULTISPECIES: hypothetical protein [unclassified Crossiella]|uniref:hypothetical protein n=1 Tax=unclassified Crossiella TaxID=2620835 RepID=UPI001FFEEB60|nr:MULTISPECIES: hypothetical protein [unclassified Crossiella]MCK2243699.1 hypothetical protein [Crossiella sp. S99.2]MCK2257558.1 hypothetical protein [Crossiella sp. S99.1]
MTTHNRVYKAAACVLVPGLVLVSACTPKNSAVPQPKPSQTSSASPPSTSTDPSSSIRSAYQEFWQVAAAIDKQPESEWQTRMSAVAADPQLRRTVQGLGLLREQSVVLYGSTTARITNVELAGDRATVQDCQDGSKAGQADAKTGKPKTVGVARNPVTATMQRGTDGRWRVSDVVFGGGACR